MERVELIIFDSPRCFTRWLQCWFIASWFQIPWKDSLEFAKPRVTMSVLHINVRVNQPIRSDCFSLSLLRPMTKPRLAFRFLFVVLVVFPLFFFMFFYVCPSSSSSSSSSFTSSSSSSSSSSLALSVSANSYRYSSSACFGDFVTTLSTVRWSASIRFDWPTKKKKNKKIKNSQRFIEDPEESWRILKSSENERN